MYAPVRLALKTHSAGKLRWLTLITPLTPKANSMAKRPAPANDNAEGLHFVRLADGTAAVCREDITKRYPPPREVPDHVLPRLALALGLRPEA